MNNSSAASGDGLLETPTGPKVNFVKEILAGLTVSFVAISLGAAFGVMSGRGALAGILSAGVIALITAALGGTRIQCSGPTAPMTAVTAAMIAAIGGGLLADHAGMSQDHFINIVLLMTGLILIVAAVFRLGRFINLVPKVVISGFMNGIAVLIWFGEANTLFGLGGKELLVGGMLPNLAVAVVTTILCFCLPSILKKIHPHLSSFLPATLVAIVLMSAGILLLNINVEKVALGASLSSFADVSAMFSTNLPTHLPSTLIWPALQFALQLAMLAYLDTLLTSLVVDKKVQVMFDSNETTAQSKELAAQGVANAAVATFGGIPGAQATIRSVLILNEGAVTRLAGVMVGIFVLVEMILLQDLITAIPKAVFSGVLIKVGYDVFDWQPLRLYWNEIKQGHVPDAAHPTGRPMVTHLNMFFIAGTTIVTVLVNLNVAVVSFCVLFYVIAAFRPIHDLMEGFETEGFGDED